MVVTPRRTGPSRPFQIAVSAVLIALIAGLLSVEIVGASGERGRHRGVVTVTDCSYSHWIPHSGDVYACAGGFESDARDIRLPYVTFEHDGRLAPGARVEATVTGPADTTPRPVSESWARLAVTTGLSFLLAIAVFLVWYAPRHGRRRG